MKIITGTFKLPFHARFGARKVGFPVIIVCDTAKRTLYGANVTQHDFLTFYIKDDIL